MRKLAAAVGAALACAAAAALPVHAAARPAPAHAASKANGGYARAARDVLARARAASGGAGWNLLRGWHESGREGQVRYESWVDPLRYGMRVERHEPAGLHVHGFNGAGDWQIQPNGAVTGVADRPTVTEARTEAFFRVNGYFYPGRFEGNGDYLGVRQAGGRSFDALSVRPWGGNPRELWFDRRTHLLARMVDRNGPRPVTTEISDYRRVGPVSIAFHFAIEEGGVMQERQVESVVFTPADRALFSLPRPDSPPPAPTRGLAP
jgi:hypothetical protein